MTMDDRIDRWIKAEPWIALRLFALGIAWGFIAGLLVGRNF
jgi:hypothetical protein